MTCTIDQDTLTDGLTSPYRVGDTPNLDALAQVFVDGFYTEWCDAIADAEPQRHRKTATGGYLEQHLLFWGVPVAGAANDSQRRTALARKLIELWGGAQPTSIRELAATLVGGEASDITLLENEDPDTGEYLPATLTISFDTGLLVTNGIPQAEVSATLAGILTSLDRAAAAGVLVQLQLAGGSLWDDPGALWDAPDDLWAS